MTAIAELVAEIRRREDELDLALRDDFVAYRDKRYAESHQADGVMQRFYYDDGAFERLYEATIFEAMLCDLEVPMVGELRALREAYRNWFEAAFQASCNHDFLQITNGESHSLHRHLDKVRDWMSEISAKMRIRALRGGDGGLAPAIPSVDAKAIPVTQIPSNDDDQKKWQRVMAALETMCDHGEAYSKQSDYATRFGCSIATVNKAFNESEKLCRWMNSNSETPAKERPLTPQISVFVPQTREPDPSDWLSDDDVENALKVLIENAGPDERAQIHAMSVEERREAARKAYADPKTHELIDAIRE